MCFSGYKPLKLCSSEENTIYNIIYIFGTIDLLMNIMSGYRISRDITINHDLDLQYQSSFI